ncbi:hypothetical protein IW261DRAFT_1563587 [Armillaria novae-zelandiae]|uniref:Uncharacterized protein n=1 Tax=Armillaria novae-zelandiae TaxID=153914 RepID=A0AA39PAZ9_9AGAR|nr:hypothetical protein IW261DRAFT_1563587 [Armillaria novae-zelandiae]
MYANQYPRASHAAQIPTGWQPPYQGAPPIPQGWNVKQNDWNQGQWQFNPAFNHHHHHHHHHQQQPSQQYIPWIPSQSWAGAQQQQQQQQQQHNPYQRPIKPPSAEYLAQPVKANALDLTGMIPRLVLYPLVLYSFTDRFLVSRAQVYGEENSDDDGPHTPWIWNPRGLVEKEDDEGTIQAEFRDALGNRFAQSRGPTPTRRRSSLEHEAPPSPSPLRIQRHTSARQSSEPSPQIYATAPTPRRGASEPPVAQLSSYSQQSRHSSPERQQPQQQDCRLLQPTFSTNIVRTPDHYSNNSPTRPNSAAPSPSHISRKSSRSNSVDPELAAKMDRLSTGPTQPLVRHSSLPAHSISSSSSSTIHASAPIYTEEPSALLSPLVISHTPALPNRSLGRHHTAPTLTSIPETATRGTEPSSRTDIETSSRSIQRTSPHYSPDTAFPRSSIPSPQNNVPPPPQNNVPPGPAPPSHVMPRGVPETSPRHIPETSPRNVPETTSQGTVLPSPYKNVTPAHSNVVSSSHSNNATLRNTQESRGVPETSSRSVVPSPHGRTSPRSRTSPGSRTSPHSTNVPSPYSNVIPSPNSNVIPSPHSSRSSRSSSSRHRISSSSSGSRRTSPTHNPLPEPPREFPYSLPLPRQKTPPMTDKKVRLGFWNRRGDHLTQDWHVVYAPHGRTHPAELQGYPRTKDGYKNHKGEFRSQSSNWTELQDSLPRFGRPPVRPYDSYMNNHS